MTSPGTTVSHYVLESELARGGFGVIYRARDTRDGTLRALKAIHPDVSGREDVLRRFEREIRLVSLLRHPNIVPIVDVGGFDDSSPYFVMELLTGETLKERVERNGPMPLEACVEVLRPLVSALEAAHDKGIVHRDLKPSNVFLADRVVLLDFGIAKLIDDTGKRITSSNHVMGSLLTMAPEELFGVEPAPTMDVYGLAAVSYFMLAGVAPFASANPAALQELKLHGAPKKLRDLADIPAHVEAAIEAGLAVKPGERPQTPAAYLEALATTPEPSQDTDVAALFITIPSTRKPGPGDEEEIEALVDAAVATGFQVRLETSSSAYLTADPASFGEVRRVVTERLAAVEQPLAVFAGRQTKAVADSLSWVPDHKPPGFHEA